MKNLSLNDLNVFTVVAKCGTISEAARKLDSSPATLGRRMAYLEDSINMKLFHRHRNGYTLTEQGECVLAKLQPITTGVESFGHWLNERDARPRVRLSGGTWNMRFLAQRFSELSQQDDTFDVSLLASEVCLNIEQREIDIGLRNTQPTSPNLASRRLADLAFAAFVHRTVRDEENLPWIGLEPAHAATKSSRWVLENHDDDIGVYVSKPDVIFDLISSGMGIGVLPCFVGDSVPSLCRVGPIIDDLMGSQYVVFHNETRYEPHVRAVGDRVIDIVRQNADLYAGRGGMLAC